MDERFAMMDERISRNQEILISHSETLKYIMQNMPNIQQSKDLESRMNHLEHQSARKYKTLDGKIDTRFDKLGEQLEAIDEKMDIKFQKSDQRMDIKFEYMDEKMRTEFKALDEKIDQSINKLKQIILQKQ